MAFALLPLTAAAAYIIHDRRLAPERVVSRQMTKTVRFSENRHLRSVLTAGMTPLVGSAAFDYKMIVQIGAQNFSAIVDTGSAAFAVAASPSLGCATYYNEPCSGAVVKQKYGIGSWEGSVCQGPEISFAGLSAGNVQFVGVTQETSFFQCSNSFASNSVADSIVGMGFRSLLSKDAPSLLYSLYHANPGISKVFSMQCCPYDGGENWGTGNLVIGGIDSSFYSSNLSFTPITQEQWYCVKMESVGVKGVLVGVSPSGWNGCQTIIDSGTSMLQLQPDVYASVMAQLPAMAEDTHACFTTKQVQALPDVTINLRGVQLSIPPTTYTQPAPGRPNCRTVYIREAPTNGDPTQGAPPNILGQVVMEAYYTVFDQENRRIGFAPIAGCGTTNPTAHIVGLPNCGEPGSNCGNPSSWFDKYWYHFGTVYGIVVFIGSFVFVFSCMYVVWGLLSPRQRPQRTQGNITQTAMHIGDSELSYPLSPAIITAIPAVSNPTQPVAAATRALPPTMQGQCAPSAQPTDPAWQCIRDHSTGRDHLINPTNGRATWNFPT